MLKVSFITVCFNNLLGLQDTIESVQTFRRRLLDMDVHSEYIIVDNKSTDGTVEYLDRLNNITWISEKDRGISDAFNKGIAMSSGTHLSIINSGDTICLNECDVYIALLRSKVNSIICLDGITCNGSLLRSKPDKIGLGMYIFHPGSIIPKSIYKTIGVYDITFRISMDYEFFFRCYKSNIEFSHSDLVYVKFDEYGISNSRWLGGTLECIRAVRNNPKSDFFDLYRIILFLLKKIIYKKFN